MLGRFLHSLNEYCEEERGKRYDISDYDEYNFHKVAALGNFAFPVLMGSALTTPPMVKIWGCSRDEANEVVHEFFKSCHFAVGVLPMPGDPCPCC